MATLPTIPSIDLTAGISFPGENLVVAIINAWVTNRETMSQANRDWWDGQVKDLYSVTIGALVASALAKKS